jgi:L-asparagine oxygenase
MKPLYTFADTDRDAFHQILASVRESPYADYAAFTGRIAEIEREAALPGTFLDAVERIREDRATGQSSTHVLRNCPVDRDLPELGHANPQADKYARKATFVGEAFLALFGRLCATPLLSYATRFNGDFFTDVYAIDKYSGKQTGYSDGELVFHNDRTAHPVRADYISLLGMRCPAEEMTYTSLVEGRTLRAGLTGAQRRLLSEPHYVTPFDVVSRDNNNSLTVSEAHPVLESDYGIRYLDTHTYTSPDAPPEAKDALIALRDSLVRAEKKRHRILEGDLLVFANQNGLHSRELIEVVDPERSRARWLLKTYAYRDAETADRFSDRWVNGVVGRVGD